ncbi:replication-relaxation family protein [Streptomyces sp. NBC_00063]|uniref:replication-relaxation family protein n=1 Tax=Streptomyces sp. NBC_00063 TaxID=2975638 RepID=UPI00225BF8FA|nr:replication-relaxation family protein [Streptomyces sp. NBC_00063]MCX5441248.1 replication-relaxation family protein [Streptomyces sp. NBC_00063]
MASKNALWPYGSTAPLREDILRVLGVLKVATAEQIQELTRPHLTYRHPAPSNRGSRTAAHRNAALDLARHGLVISEGRSRAGTKLYGLTSSGLEAAARALERPLAEMGSIARGAASHGAAHALDVNATVLGLLQPRPTQSAFDRLSPADQAVVDSRPQGLGSLEAMSTEVGLPVTGTDAEPGYGSVQADLVVSAYEDQLPLMFVEVDRSTMVPERVVAKIRRYQQYVERRDKQGRLWWRARWHPPEDQQPVVALVLSGRSESSVLNRAAVVMNLVDNLKPPFPVIGTTLNRLHERGPWGQTWWNAARGGSPQSLDQALDLPTPPTMGRPARQMNNPTARD